jgi:hypothetical protein
MYGSCHKFCDFERVAVHLHDEWAMLETRYFLTTKSSINLGYMWTRTAPRKREVLATASLVNKSSESIGNSNTLATASKKMAKSWNLSKESKMKRSYYSWFAHQLDEWSLARLRARDERREKTRLRREAYQLRFVPTAFGKQHDVASLVQNNFVSFAFVQACDVTRHVTRWWRPICRVEFMIECARIRSRLSSITSQSSNNTNESLKSS